MTPTPTPDIKHTDRLRQLAEARQQILNKPAEQVLAAILEHPQPAALVHSFPETDLHFLLHDIGIGNATPLIALASNRQWEYLLDMEVWDHDQLNFQHTTTWLQLLLQADPDRLIRWCFEEKLELLELYLFRNIETRIRESDQAPSDFGEGFLTDDDTFYIKFVDYPVSTPQEEAFKTRRNEMIGQLLQRLSIFDHPRYQGLLLEAAGVIPSETEEELYRMRNVRLGEKGLLPFDEAIGVYQPLPPGGLAARGKKVLLPPSTEKTRMPVPQLATTHLEGDDLFVRALKSIQEPHIIDQLQVELAGLCNQVITADQKTIRGREQLKSVIAKVNAYLSIGLELIIAGSTENLETEASNCLKQHLLADIFRTGFASALQLKWQATRWRSKSWCQAQQVDLTFWDEAWLGLLGGLLIDSPKFYDPDHSGSNYREFRTHQEIEATGLDLNRVTSLDHLFQQMGISMAPAAENRFLTYKNLLLTMWARSTLDLSSVDLELSNLSISLADFNAFFSALWTLEKNRRIIGDAKKTQFLNWVAGVSDISVADLSEDLGSVFEDLFSEIERELASVEAGNLDPRHVHLFLLKP